MKSLSTKTKFSKGTLRYCVLVDSCTPVLVAHPSPFSQLRLRPPSGNISCQDQYFLVYQSLGCKNGEGGMGKGKGEGEEKEKGKTDHFQAVIDKTVLL